MADLYMHSRLCEDIITELNPKIIKNTAYVGAQGPDPLYYNVMTKVGKISRYYGDRMHDTSTRDYLIDMTRQLKANYTIDSYSYYLGFLCHYALDVFLHPYVYYHTGLYNKDDKSTYKYRGLHLKFERAIDAALVLKEKNKPLRKLKITKECFPVKEVDESVTKMMGNVINNKFKITNGKELMILSINQMYNTLNRINSDRFGIKKVFYKIFDLFNIQDLKIQDLSFFVKLDKFDYLNLQKNTWHHPITNEAYNSSVIEIYDQAKNFAIDLITKTAMYLKGNKSIDLMNVFTNLSFNSGIDCDQEKPFQYFDIYRK